MPDDLSLGWHHSSRDADEVLRDEVARLLVVGVDSVRVGRLCGACGSSEHGQPWATGAHVSLSRSGVHLLTAVSTGGPVGVDVESVAAVARGSVLILHPTEERKGRADHDGHAEELASLWVRKEAILKLLGRGLATPMSEVRLAEYDVRDLEAPPGFRAALARSEHR